jgi:succinate dehydrogenase hydrophobic anchor subunit
MWVLHIDKVGEKITIDRVADRLQSPWSIAVYAVLLAAVLYHALNGILNIAADFNLGARAHKILSWALLGVGVAGLGLGIATLVNLVQYS